VALNSDHSPPCAKDGPTPTPHYCGFGPTIRAPFRKVRYDNTTGRFVSRPLSQGMKAVNRTHAALRAPGERANADLKNWKILRKVRSSPSAATILIDAIQALMIKHV
jgi:hypothetical protein